MIKQCSNVMDLLYEHNTMSEETRKPQFNKNIKEVNKCLKSAKWNVFFNDIGYVEIQGTYYYEEE